MAIKRLDGNFKEKRILRSKLNKSHRIGNLFFILATFILFIAVCGLLKIYYSLIILSH